jgi:hypothetical protein
MILDWRRSFNMDETTKPIEPMERKRDHERTDAPAKPLLFFAAGMVGLVVFGLVVSLIAFKYFVKHQPLGPPASPFENVRMLPPGPRLQVSAPQDLARYKAQQEKILNSYGWVDQNAGIVRIPIKDAMSLLLQRGVPVRNNGPKNSAELQTAASSPGGLTGGPQQTQTNSTTTGMKK